MYHTHAHAIPEYYDTYLHVNIYEEIASINPCQKRHSLKCKIVLEKKNWGNSAISWKVNNMSQ